MPPKKTTTASKPAAKGPAAGKTVAKAPAKGATGAGASKGGATGGKPAEKPAEKKEAKPIKKVLVPEEVGLKEVANVMGFRGDVGLKLKDSNRWLFLIDRNGNVGTFIKYRDVNYLVASLTTDLQPEPMRKALMGSLRYGKPNVIDISGTDQAGIMEKLKEKFDQIYPGLYSDLMDRSIMEEDKYRKLYVPATDEDEYKNPYDYRVSDFQFIILTDLDPASTAMEDFFPVIIN